MYFQREILIRCPAEEVFGFFCNKHLYHQPSGSAVLHLEKTTSGLVKLGTRFREVVRMLPWYTVEIFSEVTCFEPYEVLEEQFESEVMHGRLYYEFIPKEAGTLIVQREWLHFKGPLRVLEPIIRLFLMPKIDQRLQGIKTLLENKFPPETQA